MKLTLPEFKEQCDLAKDQLEKDSCFTDLTNTMKFYLEKYAGLIDDCIPPTENVPKVCSELSSKAQLWKQTNVHEVPV